MQDNDKALIELFKEMYQLECKRRTRVSIVCFVMIILTSILVIFSSLLLRELASYQTITVTETTTTSETYTNGIDGDNANIVNGNQYNDNATHNEN